MVQLALDVSDNTLELRSQENVQQQLEEAIACQAILGQDFRWEEQSYRWMFMSTR